jgi:hypothetical protein
MTLLHKEGRQKSKHGFVPIITFTFEQLLTNNSCKQTERVEVHNNKEVGEQSHFRKHLINALVS